jgi:hypothetical protein
MLGADYDIRTIEIGKLTAPHIDRTNAQAHVLGIVDAVEIDEPLQRLLEGGGVAVTDELIRRKPVVQRAWGEKSRAGRIPATSMRSPFVARKPVLQ